MKQQCLLIMLAVFTAWGCKTPLQTLDHGSIPLYVRDDLAKISFDSNFSIIQKPVGMAASNGANLVFNYIATLKGDRLVGSLRKDSSMVGFESVTKAIPINFVLYNMCCGNGHTPKHCANNRQGMIDSTIRHGCGSWSASVRRL